MDPRFRSLGRKEVDVLNNCVNADLPMEENEEVLDVCVAIQTIADRKAEKVRIMSLLNSVENLVKNTRMTVEQAMDALEISADDRKKMAQPQQNDDETNS